MPLATNQITSNNGSRNLVAMGNYSHETIVFLLPWLNKFVMVLCTRIIGVYGVWKWHFIVLILLWCLVTTSIWSPDNVLSLFYWLYSSSHCNQIFCMFVHLGFEWFTIELLVGLLDPYAFVCLFLYYSECPLSYPWVLLMSWHCVLCFGRWSGWIVWLQIKFLYRQEWCIPLPVCIANCLALRDRRRAYKSSQIYPKQDSITTHGWELIKTPYLSQLTEMCPTSAGEVK